MAALMVAEKMDKSQPDGVDDALIKAALATPPSERGPASSTSSKIEALPAAEDKAPLSSARCSAPGLRSERIAAWTNESKLAPSAVEELASPSSPIS